MARTATIPARYIRPETITIGDTIRATIKIDDVEVSHVGTVAKREHHSNITEFLTKAGQVILTTYTFDDRRITVTLLDRSSDRHPTLFEEL